MTKLKKSYISKAIIFPIIVVAILVIIAVFTVPKIIQMIPTGTDSTNAVTEYNAEDYYLVDYKNFHDLRLNNFTGWLSSDDIALGCAVTYKSEDEDTSAASLLERSSEPWNNGCVVIIGDNTDKEFRNLHKATMNNEVTIQFYQHDSYTYKITDIISTINKDEINDYMAENRLIMCLPYNNFSDLGNTYYYTAYIAELVQ
jgi:flagellar basal body-associated protein FliL